MEVLGLAILGIVQGLTEFLPISSSGHLVLLSNLFGIEDSLFVSILLHLATLLSICVVLRKEVFEAIRKPLSSNNIKLALATIPTCLIVMVLMPLISQSFGGGYLSVCFLITALILFTSQEYSRRKKSFNNCEEISYKQALIIGIAQGFAVFPGISRSGTTISAGLLCGAKRSETAKFSFLLSIPIILLSLVMEIYKITIKRAHISINWTGTLLAFVIAFIVGVLTLKLMIRATEKANFKWFAFYLLFIAIMSLII